MPASVNAILGSKGLPKGGRPRHVSTVRSKGGPKRTLTYQGTPVSTKGIPPSKAPSRAIQVQKALERVQKAYAKPGGVTGPGISKGESKFYSTLAKKTGLSPRVLAAQGTQEGGADDDFNILNIGHTDSGSLGLTKDTRFSSPKSAAKLTAKFFKGKEFGASPAIQNILKSAGKPEEEQVKSIAGSGWATDPNYEAGIRSAAQGIKATPGKKANPKDEKTLAKAGIDARRPSSPSNHKPFKGAAKGTKAAKIINPKWDPDSDGHGETFLAKGISKAVKRWSNRYNVQVGEAKAESGHVSPGHLVTGTATDVYPQEDTEAGWDKLEKGLAVLGKQGFEVGYDGSVPGTQNWSNHGRGNHAHIEWVGQGSDPSAIKKLAGLTDAQIRAMERGAGGGGGIAGTSGTTTSGGITPKANVPDKEKKLSPKEKLARIRAKYGETTTSSTSPSSSLRRKYGSPVV